MNSRFSNNLETFNECTMLVLLYALMLFSDFVSNPENRSQVGIIYILVVALFGAVHLFIMLGVMCHDAYRYTKRWCILRKHRKKMKAKLKQYEDLQARMALNKIPCP